MQGQEQVSERTPVSVGDEVGGLVRRVRRLAKWSQRQLAQELGVSQSAVAKWETGRTCPSARTLVKVLGLVELALAALAPDGQRTQPMSAVAARDAADRRYPAHTFVWAEGWWAPERSETTAWYSQILNRSQDLELPRVRYSRWWQAPRPPSLADLAEHPTWPELVAEARAQWCPPRRSTVAIPAWAFADTKKSRNRRPEEFRVRPHATDLPRRTDHPRRTNGDGVPVETPGESDARRQ